MVAPTLEASAIVANSSPSGTDRTFSVTIPSSLTDSIIVFSIGWYEGNNGVSTVEFDGSTSGIVTIGTDLDSNGPGDQDGIALRYILNPPSGTFDIDVTFDVSQATEECVVMYRVYSGVDQTDPIDVFNSPSDEGINASFDESITTTVDDCALNFWVSDYNNSANGSVSGWTQLQTSISYTESWHLADAGTAALESWTWSGSSGSDISVATVAISPVQASTVAVGQSTETDTGQSVSIEKQRDVGQSSETDTGQTISISKASAVGQASETDTGQAVASEKQRDVGLASETDTGQAVTASFGSSTVAIGQSTETDTGQAVSISKTSAVGQAEETDAGQAVTSVLTLEVAVGQASETDTGQTVGAQVNPRVTIVDSWTEVGTSITASPTFAVTSGITDGVMVARTSSAGGSLRTVTALSYGNQAMTLVSEESTTSGRDLHTALWILDDAGLEAAVDTEFDITSDNSNATQFRIQAATYANVNQTGLTLDSFDVNATGGAVPTPEALTTANRGIAIIAAGSNTGTSDEAGIDITYSNLTERLESVGTQSYSGIADVATDGTDFTASLTYTDTSVGHMLGMSLAVADGATLVGQAEETDTGQAVSRQKTRDVGQATETDTGFVVTPVAGAGTVAVGQAAETDTGQAVTIDTPSIVSVGQAAETDSGQQVINGASLTVAVGQAEETDSADEVTPVPSGSVSVGLATETDTAQAIFASIPVAKAVGQAVETDSADAVSLVGQVKVEIHEPWTEVTTSITATPAFAIASGTVRPVLVVRTSSAGSTQREVTVVNYGGQELTKVAEELTTSFRDLQTAIWILDAAGLAAAVTDEFEIITDNTEATQFRLQAAVYNNVNQTDPVLDSFDVNASSGTTPSPEVLTTEDGGRIVIAAGSNFGTSDDPNVNVTYNNLTERLESVGTQSYASIGDAEADGTDFTASLTYTDTNVGHMVGISLSVGLLTVGIGQAEETDTGQNIDVARQRLAGQAAETDTAQAATPVTGVNVSVGQAIETDSAQSATPVQPGVNAVGQAEETDTAGTVTPRLSVSQGAGQATETDSAGSIATVRRRLLGTAGELDTAFTIVGQETGVVTLQDRQREAGASSFGKDRLQQATEVEAMRLRRARMIRERDDEDLLALIPAMAKALLK